MTTRKRKAPELPPLPASVLTALGDVAVLVVDDLRDPDDQSKTLFGYWDAYTRTISIRANLHPTAAWITLFHEKTHADLAEIGITIPDEMEEAICNSVAAARLAELRATLEPSR